MNIVLFAPVALAIAAALIHSSRKCRARRHRAVREALILRALRG